MHFTAAEDAAIQRTFREYSNNLQKKKGTVFKKLIQLRKAGFVKKSELTNSAFLLIGAKFDTSIENKTQNTMFFASLS